jgi:hypothetical protein
VKTTLKGRRFQGAEDIKNNVNTKVNAAPLHTFNYSFVQIFQRGKKTVAVETDYLKENKTNCLLLLHVSVLTDAVLELSCLTLQLNLTVKMRWSSCTVMSLTDSCQFNIIPYRFSK